MSAWWLLLPLAVLTLLPWAIGVWEDEMTDLKLKRAREAQQAVVDSTDYSEIEKSAQVRVVELEAELTELREDRDRLKSNLLALDTAAVKRYDELREAVREYLDGKGGWSARKRLRQLIEEEE